MKENVKKFVKEHPLIELTRLAYQIIAGIFSEIITSIKNYINKR